MLFEEKDYVEVLQKRIDNESKFTIDDVKKLNHSTEQYFSKAEEEIILCIADYLKIHYWDVPCFYDTEKRTYIGKYTTEYDFLKKEYALYHKINEADMLTENELFKIVNDNFKVKDQNKIFNSAINKELRQLRGNFKKSKLPNPDSIDFNDFGLEILKATLQSVKSIPSKFLEKMLITDKWRETNGKTREKFLDLLFTKIKHTKAIGSILYEYSYRVTEKYRPIDDIIIISCLSRYNVPYNTILYSNSKSDLRIIPAVCIEPTTEVDITRFIYQYIALLLEPNGLIEDEKLYKEYIEQMKIIIETNSKIKTEAQKLKQAFLRGAEIL